MIGPIVLVLRVMLALALYAFLALVLWMLWQDIRRTGHRARGRGIPSITLRIHTEKARALNRHFQQSEVSVGRDPSCDVGLADKSISAHQARLFFQRGHWWLEDLDSTNGTRLNHKKLSSRAVLAAGDEITCGKVRVVVGSATAAVRSAISEVETRDG